MIKPINIVFDAGVPHFLKEVVEPAVDQVEMLTPEMSAKYFPPEGLAAPRRTTIAMAIV